MNLPTTTYNLVISRATTSIKYANKYAALKHNYIAVHALFLFLMLSLTWKWNYNAQIKNAAALI